LLDFAGHYRFDPRPVAIARGNEKGCAAYYTSLVWLTVIGTRPGEPPGPVLGFAIA
jgi:hypothetical protein